MIIQGTHYAGDVRDRADAIVVGTGAGSCTLAAYLAERGWDIAMVEKGGLFRAEDFTQREEDAMADFNGRRGFDSTADNAVFLSYVEAVGGTTIHYWGDSFRTPPDRLAHWQHLLRAAPLGAEPDDTFAGTTGEAHRIRGLYVVDGAGIPTSVSVDPSLTIMGVARWIAAAMHARLGRAGA